MYRLEVNGVFIGYTFGAEHEIVDHKDLGIQHKFSFGDWKSVSIWQVDGLQIIDCVAVNNAE